MSHPNNPTIAIIGSGFGGLGFAIWLKRHWNFEDFVILEKASEVGGTWRGCSSDVPIHWYSLSTDLKPDWRASHGFQSEIHDYLLDLTSKYSLREHCVFNTLVLSADWDKTIESWRIVTKDLKTGETKETIAKILISAAGILHTPYTPYIPGAEEYNGISFHSAQWRHDVDLHGKRVAVLGNGCSATQFVPIIAQDSSTQITQFCRTPMWYVGREKPPYSESSKWIFAHIPFIMRIHRYMIAARYELTWLFIFFWKGKLGDYLRKAYSKYMRDTAPVEYADKLIPSYPPGCKRFILDTGYLTALHQPNLTPNFDGVDKITADGIVTKKGEHLPFDVIIYATGFKTDGWYYDLRGRTGQTLDEYFDAHGGPTAYLGSTIPGFPNFFTIAGPNTTTGHASVVFSEEVQFDYALQLYEPIISGVLSTIEPTVSATDAYNHMIDRRLSASVWSNCTSWYRTGATGRIFATFPGPLSMYWWYMRRPNWQHYQVQGGSKKFWEMKRRLAGVLRLMLTFGSVGLGGLIGYFWMEGTLGAVLHELSLRGTGAARQIVTGMAGVFGEYNLITRA
ncbi:hypothetical protein EWM64_g1230 [Hericium alpestre]|uniref:Uncharacterized protein n=1 Tax=Hericium alpestre TaxID=135208 RepID=A0A4Z0A7R8_9AGAM|nr:hypothetical protein EWM64_g1230 [Hericium alpestre]